MSFLGMTYLLSPTRPPPPIAIRFSTLFVCLFLPRPLHSCPVFFFFNDTATTEIYTLSLHDALPISLVHLGGRVGEHRDLDPEHGAGDGRAEQRLVALVVGVRDQRDHARDHPARADRSEEHTSELQSPDHLVCRLLLEKKKKQNATEP